MLETFGYRVRKLRLERRWSQQELSMRAGISTPHISSIERSKRHPSLHYAQRMADALGVSLEALCDETVILETPKMKNSTDEWPSYLHNFILNESAAPYLEAAQRMSTLPEADSKFLTMVIELMVQNHKNHRFNTNDVEASER